LAHCSRNVSSCHGKTFVAEEEEEEEEEAVL
jgi:hypothetical protein